MRVCATQSLVLQSHRGRLWFAYSWYVMMLWSPLLTRGLVLSCIAYKYRPYRAVNTLRLGYKNQSFNDLWGNNRYFYNWDLTLYSTVVIICTASLTFNNSTFCPHTVFMCFVWIWEQTAIISLYSINWLVCITETECVYCAVRTECLYKMHVNLNYINAPCLSSCNYCYQNEKRVKSGNLPKSNALSKIGERLI